LQRRAELTLADSQAELEHLRIEARSLREKGADLARAVASKTKLALAAEVTSDGACICSTDGLIEWVNKSWEQTTGYALSEVKGKKPGHVLQGNDTDQGTVARLREAVLMRKTVTAELFNYAKDGSKLWVRLTIKPIYDEKGIILGYLGIQTDLTLRRLTQKRLERLNERAELALSAGNFGIWDWSPQPNHCEWDDRCTRLHGAGQSVGTYEEWMGLVYRPDLPALEAHLRAVLLGKEQLKANYRLASDISRQLEIRGQVLRDEQGTPLRMTGLVRDISDEVALREQLHLAGERLRLSLRGANDGIWEWKVGEDLFETDEKWAQITGLPADSGPMTRQGFERNIHPEDLPLLRTVLDAHLGNRSPHFEAECRLGRKRGDWIWVRWRGTVVARELDGRPRMVCGTYSDVSEKHRMDEALRRSALLLRQMCQQMGIAAWEIEAENFNLHWTEELDLLHAAPPDFEPSLEHFLALYPADSRKELSRALELCLEKGESFDVEVRWRAPGSDKNSWFRWFGNPVMAEDRTIAVCGLIHDVTAIREAAAQRRELDSRLAELHQYEALSAITDDLAYDLNTMLGSMLGFQELATEELAPGHKAREHIDEALRMTNRTHDVIRQVLLLNRVKPVARIGLRPSLLVDELCERLAGSLPPSITLVRTIDRRCPPIMGDAAQIQQAFLHIAHHAAGVLLSEPGKLEISLCTEEVSIEQAATLGLSLAGRFACLQFRVSREKLGDEEWSQLFDHPSHDPGLNMTAARKILGEHQGVLSVEYHPVHGGIVQAWLPLAETVQSSPPASAPVPTGRGERVWIVDEERFIARLAKLTLEHNGYLAESFRSLEECREALMSRQDRCAVLLIGSTLGPRVLQDFLKQAHVLVPRLAVVVLGKMQTTLPTPESILLEEPFTAADLNRAVSQALAPAQTLTHLMKVGP
jgi:PAS domain S-box-containing protein